jgi:hypothetical protein
MTAWMARVLTVASSATAPKSVITARLVLAEAARAMAGQSGVESIDRMMRRRVL